MTGPTESTSSMSLRSCVCGVISPQLPNWQSESARGGSTLTRTQFTTMCQTVIVKCLPPAITPATLHPPPRHGARPPNNARTYFTPHSKVTDILWTMATPTVASSSSASSCDQIYELKITLLHTHPPIWRRVQVPATLSLSKLYHVIQFAMRHPMARCPFVQL
jgi:Plasmid pRiA4b ORF-3-like protein